MPRLMASSTHLSLQRSHSKRVSWASTISCDSRRDLCDGPGLPLADLPVASYGHPWQAVDSRSAPDYTARTMDYDTIADLPRSSGSYALLVSVDSHRRITIGKKGSLEFRSGDYVYVGSARGSGGLRARLLRHERRGKRLHWHIDYLLAHASLAETHTVTSDQKLECDWAQSLSRLPGAQISVPGFGSSDCHCTAHLVHFPLAVCMARLQKVLVAHPEDALHNLRLAIGAGDDETCEDVACALSARRGACQLLAPLLNDAQADTRWWAVRALAAASCSQSAAELIGTLADPDDSVRCAAALALGELGAREAVPHLVTLLGDDEGLVRTASASALALVGVPAIPALAAALESPLQSVRVQAGHALHRIRHEQAAPALCQALSNSNYLVRSYACDALHAMGLLDEILLA